MKRYFLIVFLSFLFSCEDIITPDLPVNEPIVVVDASTTTIGSFTGRSGVIISSQENRNDKKTIKKYLFIRI